MIRRALVAVAPLLVSACGDVSTDGPCHHDYREPIITVTSTDASNLHLSDVRINGQAVALDGLVAVGSDVPTGVTLPTVDGDGLACQVPCSFGIDEGEWHFLATAPDGRRLEIRRRVRYAEFSGGCPSFNDGGVTVEVDLAPQGVS
jgi:hypothetical protein